MIKETIAKLVEGKSLSESEAQAVMAEVMEGTPTPAQLAAFLIALRMKGETPDEILGMARTMRAKAVHVQARGPLLDTCGTGGDGSGTYNISTAAALVAAAAGIKVAKHGNRAASSQCGSADVLEALGGRISMTPEQAERCLEKVGFVFLLAPTYHPAMRHAGPVRTEIGVRTIFNFLGPLANPAGVTRQVLGVSRKDLAPVLPAILQRLGTERAMVVHSLDGLDEITLSGATDIYEVDGRELRHQTVTAEDFGLSHSTVRELAGGTQEQNAEIIRALFRGEKGPKRDVLLANAAAALIVGGKARTLREGVTLAAQTIDSGAAARTLAAYVDFGARL